MGSIGSEKLAKLAAIRRTVLHAASEEASEVKDFESPRSTATERPVMDEKRSHDIHREHRRKNDHRISNEILAFVFNTALMYLCLFANFTATHASTSDVMYSVFVTPQGALHLHARFIDDAHPYNLFNSDRQHLRKQTSDGSEDCLADPVAYYESSIRTPARLSTLSPRPDQQVCPLLFLTASRSSLKSSDITSVLVRFYRLPIDPCHDAKSRNYKDMGVFMHCKTCIAPGDWPFAAARGTRVAPLSSERHLDIASDLPEPKQQHATLGGQRFHVAIPIEYTICSLNNQL
ncbi:hypothetical protein K431DRAFT_290512 [Polychaeton citri CBS 116435]|uniref:Uncharacterized protein n=1 Tax=Polychaeton citri CBS 116435 TaxID=1314669 RepID=A0A9P4UUR1_9PEZI|nr:hypothetical protein K431DRAFT_290512 [Polychaeton citri CBS 116435]